MKCPTPGVEARLRIFLIPFIGIPQANALPSAVDRCVGFHARSTTRLLSIYKLELTKKE